MGGGQPDPSFIFYQIEEQIALLIGSESKTGMRGGGDTDTLSKSKEIVRI